MIEFFIGDFAINLQITPLYGTGVGAIYYDPSLEDDAEVDQEDMYYRVQILLLLFCLHVTWYKWMQ
jgi:hypothetical protein